MRDSRQRLYLVAWASMCVLGIVLGLPGALLGLPEVVERLSLTLADRGTLIASLFVGVFFGSIVSGPIIEGVGGRAVLTASIALVAICLPLVAFTSSYTGAAAVLALVGFSLAGINTAANARVSDVFADERGRRLNMLAVAAGVGGVTMPVAVALTAGRVSWTTMVFGAAALAAIVALAGARVEIATSPQRSRRQAGAIGQLLRQPGLCWIVLLVMLGGGNEVTMAGWLSTYLIARGFPPSTAAWLLSTFWLGLIAGRLVLSPYVDRAKGPAIAQAGLAGALCVLMLILAESTDLLAVMPFATGAAMAIVVPTALALAAQRWAANSGLLFGVLLTATQVGGVVVPAIVGYVAERAGLRSAMSVLVVNGLLIASVAFIASSRGRE